MKVYVASSWRNDQQQDVVTGLRHAGHEVYDFKNPRHAGSMSLQWNPLSPGQSWTPEQYREAITTHDLARHGFFSDFEAMKWADACVMVQPCGRSAHIEAGYFVGANKPLVILLAPGQEPELMLRMAYETGGDLCLCLSMDEVINALGTSKALRVRS